MARERFLPTNPDEFAAWMNNFARQLPDFATKYGISAATITQVEADNDWTQYWVPAKLQTEFQKKQVNDYFKTITEKANEPQPAEPTLDLPPTPPPAVPPGMRRRISDIASFIKGNRTVYTEADGEVLGIVGEEHGEPDVIQPEFSLKTMSNFNLAVEFRKNGFDSVRVEYQHKGDAAWLLGNILTNSPGALAIQPKTPGEAEQVFVRAIYQEKNQPVGDYSDIKTALIAP